jgi:hypothetical protein
VIRCLGEDRTVVAEPVTGATDHQDLGANLTEPVDEVKPIFRLERDQ